jgi:hypothetical protein
VAASPAVVTLHLNPAGLVYVGSFTLTAQGGPISSFRISNPDPLDLAIRPRTGSLAPGQTVTVRLTVLAPLRVFASRWPLIPASRASSFITHRLADRCRAYLCRLIFP